MTNLSVSIPTPDPTALRDAVSYPGLRFVSTTSLAVRA